MATRIERKRVLFAAGKLPAKRKPTCLMGHRGPFVYSETYTQWMHDFSAEVGLDFGPVRYGQCKHCGSHIAIPAGRAA